jgi:hypothetical protein
LHVVLYIERNGAWFSFYEGKSENKVPYAIKFPILLPPNNLT